MSKELKVTPRIDLHEIFECDGGFFYVHKTKVKPYRSNYDYTKYYLKKVVSKEQLLKVAELLK